MIGGKQDGPLSQPATQDPGARKTDLDVPSEGTPDPGASQ